MIFTIRPYSANSGSRMPVETPKRAPRGPKMPPRRPKIAPRRHLAAPRWPKMAPMGAQERPKMAPDGSQNAPRRSQDASKMQFASHLGLRALKTAPKGPQMSQNCTQDGPSGAKIMLICSQCSPNCFRTDWGNTQPSTPCPILAQRFVPQALRQT